MAVPRMAVPRMAVPRMAAAVPVEVGPVAGRHIGGQRAGRRRAQRRRHRGARDQRQRYHGLRGLERRRVRRHGCHPVAHPPKPGAVDQVDLVDHDQVGRLQLAPQRIGQQRVGRLFEHRRRVDQHDDAVERQPRIGEPHLRDPPRIRDPARLDHDRIERDRRRQHPDQRVGQVVADRAARAPVGQRDRVAVVGRDQLGVDVQRSEIVDQHREASPPRLAQHPREQRGLAGAEKAADDGQRQRGAPRAHAVPGIGSTRPPRTVPAIRTSFSASGATASGSSCSTQKSANLPTSIEPIRSSIRSV